VLDLELFNREAATEQEEETSPVKVTVSCCDDWQ
jgi:hypothetical protein